MYPVLFDSVGEAGLLLLETSGEWLHLGELTTVLGVMLGIA